MSNSSLAGYIDKGTGNYNSRKGLISKICIHTAKATGDCRTLSDILASTSSGSFNYGIGNDGLIGLYVEERFRAWATGDPDNDDICVNIMVCNSSTASNLPISSQAYESLISLCVDICRRNFIFSLKYTGRPESSNLVTHSMFANVDCPGSYLISKIPDLIAKVNSELSHPALAESQSYALKSQSNIVVDAINPYVITVDPGTLGVNYNNMRIAGVVGVMFNAGGLFDSSHNRKQYINTSLKSQVAEVASSYLPYALYCDVRARDSKEAAQECEELYYVVSKYPPKLGIWMHLELPYSNTAVNNMIMDIYYKYIVRWGLKSKCGIYCNKSQLSRISWSNYCNKFSLWIIAPVPGVSNLPELETPNFFKLEEM